MHGHHTYNNVQFLTRFGISFPFLPLKKQNDYQPNVILCQLKIHFV